MQIEFVARNVAFDDGLRAEVKQRLAAAGRLLLEPVDVRVVLEGGAGEKHRFAAELHLSHRGGNLHARAESTDLAASVAEAAVAVVEQARRGRQKRVDRRRRASRREANRRHWPVDVVARASVGNGRPEIVRSSRIEIEPMTLGEAAARLERSRNEFYVFLDSESERLSVLYKRRDEHYGLIAPELE
jgi:putative sigma-54 modulation protein